MAYIERCEYVAITGKPVPDFERLQWEMSRYLDRATTGIDDVSSSMLKAEIYDVIIQTQQGG